MIPIGFLRTSAIQINRIPFMLACPFLPTMMWSCMEMPSGAAMSMIAVVMRMSACDGEGSPLGCCAAGHSVTCRDDQLAFRAHRSRSGR
jgi:hypothetical protein